MQSFHANPGGLVDSPPGDAGAMVLDHPAKRSARPTAQPVAALARLAALGHQLRVAFAKPADHPFTDLLAALELAEREPGRSRLRGTPVTGHRPEFELA